MTINLVRQNRGKFLFNPKKIMVLVLENERMRRVDKREKERITCGCRLELDF